MKVCVAAACLLFVLLTGDKLVQYLETVKGWRCFFLTAPPAPPCYPRPSMPPLLLALALFAALAPPAPVSPRPARGQVRQR